MLLVLYAAQPVFAERDWEYWSSGSVSVPVKENISFLVLPEWRFKNDFHDMFMFKLETGPSFKINTYLNIIPFYVYQEKRSGGIRDRSDLAYLDAALNIPLKNFFDMKFSNRLRYQYDFDKDKTTWRDSVKISKPVKIGGIEFLPYFSEEPFYDVKKERVTEHRTAAGISCGFSKNISAGAGYMVDTKKGNSKWSYTNVLLTNVSIKF